jgi:hypothetical protein
MAIIAVKHMDEVLRTALVVANPEQFLSEPSHVVDWRVVEAAAPADPSDAH